MMQVPQSLKEIRALQWDITALKTLTTNGSCVAIGAYALEDLILLVEMWLLDIMYLKETSTGQNNTAIRTGRLLVNLNIGKVKRSNRS